MNPAAKAIFNQSSILQLEVKLGPVVLQEHGIDISKFDELILDVQGAELKVIHGFGSALRHFSWITSEVTIRHSCYRGNPLFEEVSSYLLSLNFVCIELLCDYKSEYKDDIRFINLQ